MAQCNATVSTRHVVICDDFIRTGFDVSSYTGPTVFFIIYRPSCDKLARGYPLDCALFSGYSINTHKTCVDYVNKHQSGDGIERKITHCTYDAFLNQANLTLNIRYMFPGRIYVNFNDFQFFSYLIKLHVHEGKVYCKTSALVCINYPCYRISKLLGGATGYIFGGNNFDLS